MRRSPINYASIQTLVIGQSTGHFVLNSSVSFSQGLLRATCCLKRSFRFTFYGANSAAHRHPDKRTSQQPSIRQHLYNGTNTSRTDWIKKHVQCHRIYGIRFNQMRTLQFEFSFTMRAAKACGCGPQSSRVLKNGENKSSADRIVLQTILPPCMSAHSIETEETIERNGAALQWESGHRGGQ